MAMNVSEAQEHLRMVQDIVRTTDRTVRVPAGILIGVGSVCTVITAVMQARKLGLDVPPDYYVQPPAWVVMMLIIGVTAWRGRGAHRETLLDSYAGSAFFAALAMALTLTVTAQHRVIPPDGIGLVWAGSFSMALLVIGAMGSRVLLAGGVAMLIAVGVAGLVPGWLPGMVAVAWFVGFVIPGIVLALGARHGRAAAV
jgi:hypothetical protein